MLAVDPAPCFTNPRVKYLPTLIPGVFRDCRGFASQDPSGLIDASGVADPDGPRSPKRAQPWGFPQRICLDVGSPLPILAVPPRSDIQAALIVLAQLPKLLNTKRSHLGISEAAQAKQIGISPSVLSRILSGQSSPQYLTVVACIRWLAAH